MTDAWASIIVAVIGIVGSLLMFVLSRLRRENRDDHNIVRDILNTLHEDIKDVGDKIDNHIDWHLKK
ncbi:MAG: hypothetical protein RL463_1205 [Bacteroidota bacterium]|jgi:hypothetical protein